MRQLTDKQQAWLDAFFGDAKGDAAKATVLAGYAEGTVPAVIIGALQEEIHSRTKELITASSAKAFFKMEQLLDSPNSLGAKTTIAVAKDLMNRGGLAAAEKVEVQSNNPLFILPAKDK